MAIMIEHSPEDRRYFNETIEAYRSPVPLMSELDRTISPEVVC
jgi:hypothetical protein